MTEHNEDTITETEEGGTDMFWKPGVIIFLCLIPVAAIYAIVSVNKKKKRVLEACKRDIRFWINEYLQKGETITRPQLRKAVASSYDQGVYEQALTDLGIVDSENDGQPIESEEEETG